jgi:hypothetical protein
MWRGIAVLLTLLFGWTPLAPAFASSFDSTLPACCRKAGKHHCMMQQHQSSSGMPVVSGLKERCPCCPQAMPLSSQVQLGTLAVGDAIYAGVAQHPAVSPQTEAAFRVSSLRSHQKRGPPARHSA